jgi:hypothetical protein
MPQYDPPDLNTYVSSDSDQSPPSIDLQRLAEKIVELLKREARIERERTGRH